MNYLDLLPMAAAEREKLRRLAAPTPAALLGMIRASTDAFRHFFGSEQTDRLVEWLTLRIGPAESERLSRPPRLYPIQALTFSHKPVAPLPPKYDVDERDRVFDRLQRLRADAHPTDQTLAEIAACEARLNAMLEWV